MKKQRRVQMAQEMREAAAGGGPDEQQLANEMADAFVSDVLPENIFCSPKAGAGKYLPLLCLQLILSHVLWARAELVNEHTVSNRMWQYHIPALIPDYLI